jgi:hypothetical protein
MKAKHFLLGSKGVGVKEKGCGEMKGEGERGNNVQIIVYTYK